MSRKPVDKEFFEALCEACGGLDYCCVCCKHGKKLERGHLQRAGADGEATLGNTMPVCRSCNAKHNRVFTEDVRPDGWYDRFLWLFLRKTGGAPFQKTSGTLASSKTTLGTHSSSGQPVKPEGLIGADQVEFRQANLLSNTYFSKGTLADQEQMSSAEAQVLLAQEGTKVVEEHKLWPPQNKDKEKLITKIQQLGALNWRRGMDEIYLREPWKDPVSGRTVTLDIWPYVLSGISTYVGLAKKRQQAKVEQARRDEQQRTVSRWDTFQRRLDVPEWPEMTEADRTLIAVSKGERREVTDDELKAAEQVRLRQYEYDREQVELKKRELLSRLTTACEKMQTDEDNAFAVIGLYDQIRAAHNWDTIREAEGDVRRQERFAEEHPRPRQEAVSDGDILL